MVSIGAKSRAALPEQVANHLRDMIVENQIAPGERIRERAIAAELNVSRTPLRDALKALAAEGLVELLPNRGAVVANPGAEDVREMLEVQGVLEEHAGHLFCANATDGDIGEIHALHFEMLAAFERRERLTYFKLNQTIHRNIIEIAGNKALDGVHRMLSARLFRFRYQPNLKVEAWQSAIEEHEIILAALVERNGLALGTALRVHLKTTWEKLSKVMAEEEG
ncbi:MAG: GntR family transcriptional regulator [Alphaproteobacteria bacterium]|nr:GntR family transcriptional regulator [Alphaproteobacteria bacterium]